MTGVEPEADTWQASALATGCAAKSEVSLSLSKYQTDEISSRKETSRLCREAKEFEGGGGGRGNHLRVVASSAHSELVAEKRVLFAEKKVPPRWLEVSKEVSARHLNVNTTSFPAASIVVLLFVCGVLVVCLSAVCL